MYIPRLTVNFTWFGSSTEKLHCQNHSVSENQENETVLSSNVWYHCFVPLNKFTKHTYTIITCQSLLSNLKSSWFERNYNQKNPHIYLLRITYYVLTYLGLWCSRVQDFFFEFVEISSRLDNDWSINNFFSRIQLKCQVLQKKTWKRHKTLSRKTNFFETLHLSFI